MEKVVLVAQAQILYGATNKIMEMMLVGYMFDDLYKSFWTKSIDFVEKHQVNRIIIDQRQNGNVPLAGY